MESEKELVRWQETIQHNGTAKERDAAFAAFQSNPDGQHFVFGYSHSDESKAAQAIADRQQKTKKPGRYRKGYDDGVLSFKASDEKSEAQEQISSLNDRMRESRERRAKEAVGTMITSTSNRPNKSTTTPATAIETSQEVLSAFMGHQ